jgi:glutamate-1-semialdehyde 2,1-aminomutase
MTGGITSSKRYFPPYPLFMARGQGSKIYDVDGNQYIDCFLNAGPLLLGHNHPEVMDAVKRELDRGLLILHLDITVEFTELLKELYPCAERARLASTGTEACLFAARIARAYTGKKKLIKFHGHFHGLADQFCIGGYGTAGGIDSNGVTEAMVEDTVMLSYGDIELVKKTLDESDDIAGVILDPQMHAGGIWPAPVEYLKELRRLTEKKNVVLIYDEVITGFRLAPGGAQEYFGVPPDLIILSKAIAAGGKLAVVAGKEAIMSVLTPQGMENAPQKAILQGGTFVDGTIGVAAGIAALKVYKRLGEKGKYGKLFARAQKLRKGLEEAFESRSIPFKMNNLGPSLKMFFTGGQIRYETMSKIDYRLHDLFCMSMISEGVFLTLPTLRSIYLSFMHTDEDIDKILEVANQCLDKYCFKEYV